MRVPIKRFETTCPAPVLVWQNKVLTIKTKPPKPNRCRPLEDFKKKAVPTVSAS
jgi:hypothetical protein